MIKTEHNNATVIYIVVISLVVDITTQQLRMLPAMDRNTVQQAWQQQEQQEHQHQHQHHQQQQQQLQSARESSMRMK